MLGHMERNFTTGSQRQHIFKYSVAGEYIQEDKTSRL